MGHAVRDVHWFEALFRDHHGTVLAYARRRGVDADEVVSEVFSAAWVARDRLPDSPRPWLLKTASNFVLHQQRSAGRRTRLVGELSARAPTGGDASTDRLVDRLDADQRISAGLASCSQADRELLQLWAWDQLSTRELAQVLSCTPATVRVRLHRALRRLADRVDHVDALPTGQLPVAPSSSGLERS